MKRWRRILGYLRGWLSSLLYFESPALLCQLGTLVIVRERGVISVDDKVWLWPGVKLDASAAQPGVIARLRLGAGVSVGDRTQIHCGERIEIGEGTLISWDCVIMDRDYHHPEGGRENTAPVIIGRNVWVGCRSIILKGVTIGDDAVIGAGSVVTKDVPPRTLVAGNPAQEIRKVIGISGAASETAYTHMS